MSHRRLTTGGGVLVSHHCDKTPQIIILKKERFILVHGCGACFFLSFFLFCICGEAEHYGSGTHGRVVSKKHIDREEVEVPISPSRAYPL
jgi:hypothetical protein